MDQGTGPAGRAINWLGVASLIIGLFALAFSWIPLLGCGALPLAVLGLVTGSVGLLTARGGRTGLGFPVAGVVASALAILLPIALLFLAASAPARAPGPAPETAEPAP